MLSRQLENGTNLTGRTRQLRSGLDRRMQQLREHSLSTHGTISAATKRYEEHFSSSMNSDLWERALGLKSSWRLQRIAHGFSLVRPLETPGWTIVLYLLPTGFIRIVQISYGDTLSTTSLPNSPLLIDMSIQGFLHGVGNRLWSECPSLGALYDMSRQSPSGAIKIFLKG